ncbi:MAG TPA: Vms1/Ankzf1 family peptidyl-tRNA hydrolase [Naasia sp.]
MAQRPNSHAAVVDRGLADLLRSSGWWITVYTDASMDTADPRGVEQARRRSVLDQLQHRGVPDDQLSELSDALEGTDGVPSPATRYLLACDGRIVHNQVLPGAPVGAQVVEAGPIPHLAPLLRHRNDEIVYLVVQAGRDGGEVDVLRSTAAVPEASDAVQGRTDTLKKFQGGGWAHLRFQRHTEAIWKQTETELAAVVDRLAQEHRPRLIVVSGDVRARQYLKEQLSSRSQELVAELNVNTRGDGASEATLQEFVDQQLNEIADSDRRQDLDRLATELGKEGGAAERGIGWTVHTLRQAQVEVLFVDPDTLADRTLLALDSEPWVAAAPEDAEPAKPLGDVPAAEALLRAAVLTDAAVRIVPSTMLPDGAGAAGLLRWGTEPPTGG